MIGRLLNYYYNSSIILIVILFPYVFGMGTMDVVGPHMVLCQPKLNKAVHSEYICPAVCICTQLCQPQFCKPINKLLCRDGRAANFHSSQAESKWLEP